MNKISIIGGSGFIGTHLCYELKKSGKEFEIVDIVQSKFFPSHWKYGDIRDPKSLAKSISGNVVVHLAAIHKDNIINKAEYYETNVKGTKNLCVICKQLNIKKILFTSTVAVYGFSDVACDENSTPNPFNEYGKTKLAAEEILREWQNETASSLTILRPTVVFGEGNRGNVFNLFKQINSGIFVMIGNGKNVKSMAYVKNLAHFIHCSLSLSEPYKVFNYFDTPSLTMNELISLTRKKLGRGKNVGYRMPSPVGLAIAKVFDIMAILTRRTYSISSIRVKKFISNSDFINVNSYPPQFKQPYTLTEGIIRTLDKEFSDKRNE